MGAFEDMLGDTLRSKEGTKSTSELLAGKKVIGLYFSASWCPPCQGFTPTLNETYEKMVKEHPEFELIFVSADQDVESYDGYYKKMSFLTLPFELRETEAKLSEKFGVNSIPHLVFLNEAGEIITQEGRNLVVEVNGDCSTLWSKLGSP